jgi:hypothetical protein
MLISVSNESAAWKEVRSDLLGANATLTGAEGEEWDKIVWPGTHADSCLQRQRCCVLTVFNCASRYHSEVFHYHRRGVAGVWNVGFHHGCHPLRWSRRDMRGGGLDGCSPRRHRYDLRLTVLPVSDRKHSLYLRCPVAANWQSRAHIDTQYRHRRATAGISRAAHRLAHQRVYFHHVQHLCSHQGCQKPLGEGVHAATALTRYSRPVPSHLPALTPPPPSPLCMLIL